MSDLIIERRPALEYCRAKAWQVVSDKCPKIPKNVVTCHTR